MDGIKWKRVIYTHILIYCLGSVGAWLFWSQGSSVTRAWIIILPISTLMIILIALFALSRAALRQEQTRWLLKNKELELEAEKRTEELERKNFQLQTVLADFHHLGYFDSLTNLPNRRLFIKQMTNAITNARQSRKMVAILFIDLDNFKMINDTMGHSLGDLVLKELGVKIRNRIRPIDSVSRQGGDEFTILLDEINNMEQAKRLIEAIHWDIQEPFMLNGVEIQLEASIGVALYPRHGDDIDSLIKYADIAMYNAKEQGKNQFVLYTTEMNEVFLRRMSLNKQLGLAIQNKEFSLYYQPQVDIATSEIVGIESLVRWNNSILGPVTPTELIPIAEKNGQIIPLGEWVLSTACRQLKTWLDVGYQIPKIAVNISPVQFNDEKLVDSVKRILWETGLEPQYLELEITESVAIYNERAVLNKLTALKDIGIKVAIDDFGTGYSCLAYLSQYPVDTLKIDRSFMNDFVQNHHNRILVQTMIIMAHNFNIKVIAEGVATIEQFRLLRDYMCNEIQGFLISPPVSAEQFVNLLNSYSETGAEHHQLSVS